MTTLTKYTGEYRQETLRRIAEFWGFHGGLVGREPDAEDLKSAAEDIDNWTAENHLLFVIIRDGRDVGFVHLQRIGPIVVQLEDIFVDEALRGQGIASEAIALSEQKAKNIPGIEAMTMQVVTRNRSAMRLYHKLGYDTMSMVTLRKEFGKNRRDKKAEFLGMEFKI